jgi:subtilase family serine protease
MIILCLCFILLLIPCVALNYTTLLLCPSAAQRADLQSFLSNVSNPRHPKYLQHLSIDALHQRFAPTTQGQVLEWVQQHPDVSEVVLSTKYRVKVSHNSTKLSSKHLADGVVCGILEKSSKKMGRRKPVRNRIFPSNGPGEGDPTLSIVTAQSFQAVYQTPNSLAYTRLNSMRDISIAVIEIEAPYKQSDSLAYAGLTGTTADLTTMQNINESTASDAGDAFMEASLDVQTILSTAPLGAVELIAWGLNEDSGDWPVLTWLDILESGNVPDIISSSWGGVEEVDYAPYEMGEFYIQELVALGTTILASSGDNGAIGDGNPSCNPADGFSVLYPTNSPYVTAVAATAYPSVVNNDALFYSSASPLCNQQYDLAQLASQYDFTFTGYPSDSYFSCVSNISSPEVAVSKAANGFVSGGGFSDTYATPSYQLEAVARYLSNPSIPFPAANLYNASGRGIPDISMYGAGSVIITNGELSGAGGTSQSSPVLASMVTYLVDWSLANLNSTLGNINPLLYMMQATDPTTFHDIVTGTNNGSESVSPANCSLGGFTAAPGWNPVTGLGSPNIGRMIQWMETYFLSRNNVSSSSSSSSSSSTSSTSSTSSMKNNNTSSTSSSVNNIVTSTSRSILSSSSSTGLGTVEDGSDNSDPLFVSPWIYITVIVIVVIAITIVSLLSYAYCRPKKGKKKQTETESRKKHAYRRFRRVRR